LQRQTQPGDIPRPLNRHVEPVGSQVGREVGGRDEFDLFGTDALVAGGDGGQSAQALGLDADLLEHLGGRHQGEREGVDLCGGEVERVAVGSVADEGDLEEVAAGQDAGEEVEAVGVGGGAVGGGGVESVGEGIQGDSSAFEGLPVGAVGDEAADGGGLGVGRTAQRKHGDGENYEPTPGGM